MQSRALIYLSGFFFKMPYLSTFLNSFYLKPLSFSLMLIASPKSSFEFGIFGHLD